MAFISRNGLSFGHLVWNPICAVCTGMSNIVELPGAGLGKMITIKIVLLRPLRLLERQNMGKINFQQQLSLSKFVKIFLFFFHIWILEYESNFYYKYVLKSSVFEVLYLLKLTLNLDKGSSSLCSTASEV